MLRGCARGGSSLRSTSRTSRTAACRTAAAVRVKRSPRAESDADRKSRYVQSHQREWWMNCGYVSMRYGQLFHPPAAGAAALICTQNTKGARCYGRAMRQKNGRISLLRNDRDAAGQQRAAQVNSTHCTSTHQILYRRNHALLFPRVRTGSVDAQATYAYLKSTTLAAPPTASAAALTRTTGVCLVVERDGGGFKRSLETTIRRKHAHLEQRLEMIGEEGLDWRFKNAAPAKQPHHLCYAMESKLATGTGFLIVELMRSSVDETPKQLAERAGTSHPPISFLQTNALGGARILPGHRTSRNHDDTPSVVCAGG
jgi:hypothetical protein